MFIRVSNNVTRFSAITSQRLLIKIFKTFESNISLSSGENQSLWHQIPDEGERHTCKHKNVYLLFLNIR